MPRDYVDPEDFPPVDKYGEFIEQQDEQSQWPNPPHDAAYHGVLGEIALELAPVTEADPVGILGTLIVGFGVICGDGAGLHKGALHRAKEQIVLAGDTAKARKGTAWGASSEVMRAAYPQFDELVWTGLGSGEGITGKLERNQRATPDGQTPEYRGLIYEGEFGRLLTAMSREGSTLSHQLRNAWDDVPVGRMLSREHTVIRRHHIGMVTHITTAELATVMRTVDAASGFANRMLFLSVRRTQVLPDPGVPTEVVPHLIPRLEAAIETGSRARRFQMDDAAADHWADYYRAEAERPTFGLAGSVTARHEAHVVRLALIYAMADGADHVGVDHLRAAIALAEYARRSAVYIFGSSTGNRHADALWRLLRDEPEGEVGREDASRTLGIRNAAGMDEAVSVLTRLGIARAGSRKRSDGRGGRPRRTIQLTGPNPPNTANPEGEVPPADDQAAPPGSGDIASESLDDPAQDPHEVSSVWSDSASVDSRQHRPGDATATPDASGVGDEEPWPTGSLFDGQDGHQGDLWDAAWDIFMRDGSA